MANSLTELAGVGPLLVVAFVAALTFVVAVVGGAVAAPRFSPPKRDHNGRTYFD